MKDSFYLPLNKFLSQIHVHTKLKSDRGGGRKHGGTGIGKNDFASGGVSTLLQNSTGSIMPLGIFLFVTNENSNDFTV